MDENQGPTCWASALAAGMSVIEGSKVPAAAIREFGQAYSVTGSLNLGVPPSEQAGLVNSTVDPVGATYTCDNSRANLLTNLQNGTPVVVTITLPLDLTQSDLGGLAHAILAIGYDPTTKQFIFADPNNPGKRWTESDIANFYGHGRDFDTLWFADDFATSWAQAITGVLSGSMVTLKAKQKPTDPLQPTSPGSGGAGGGGGRGAAMKT